MYVYYDTSGRILSAVQATSNDVKPPDNIGTPLYLDDATHLDVWNNPSEYTIQNELPVYTPIDPAIKLKAAQDAKLAALDNACNQTILNGFDYALNGVSYHFYLPLTAQANFTGAKSQFKDGKITSVRWTVLNNATGQFERIDIDATSFDSLAGQVFSFIDSNIKKLRDTLEPQVESATTIDAVNAIVW